MEHMFCPQCAAQNVSDAKFCRACGANISLVPQALTGHLPEGDSKRQISVAGAAKNIFVGIGFLFLAVVIGLMAPAPANWALCFSILIAAVILLGVGTSEYLAEVERAKGERRLGSPDAPPGAVRQAPQLKELPTRDTSGIIPAASAIEETTRQLETETKRGR